MKPQGLSVVKIEPVKIGTLFINKLEIDLKHINYGLDPKTKSFRKKARSNFTIDEVVKVFQLLEGVALEPTLINENYAYFSSEVYPFWVKKWFRLIFCVEHKKTKVAGVITFYRVKK